MGRFRLDLHEAAGGSEYRGIGLHASGLEDGFSRRKSRQVELFKLRVCELSAFSNGRSVVALRV